MADAEKDRPALQQRAQQLGARLAELLQPPAARLLTRRTELALAVALTALFVLGGGLSLRSALAGLVATAAWAAIWPAAEAPAAPARAPSTSGAKMVKSYGAPSLMPCRNPPLR